MFKRDRQMEISPATKSPIQTRFQAHVVHFAAPRPPCRDPSRRHKNALVGKTYRHQSARPTSMLTIPINTSLGVRTVALHIDDRLYVQIGNMQILYAIVISRNSCITYISLHQHHRMQCPHNFSMVASDLPDLRWPSNRYSHSVQAFREGFLYTRVEFGSVQSWKTDLLHQIIRKHLDQILITLRIELRHVHELGVIIALRRILVGYGKFEVKCYSLSVRFSR